MDAIAEGTSLANFEVRDNLLLANSEMGWEYHAEFSKACEDLLQSPAEELTVDLSRVTFLFSAYMGTIGRLLAEGTQRGKRITFRVNQSLRWLFEQVGFEKMLRLEVIS